MPSPQERLAIIDRALAAIRKSAEKGEPDKADDELRWQRRRLDAQLQGGMPSAESTAAYLAALRAAEARAKKLYESGQLTLLDYLEAQYRLAEGERQAKLFSQMSGGQGMGAQGMGGMGGGMGGMPAMMGMGGGMGGQRMGGMAGGMGMGMARMPGGQGMAGMPAMMNMGNVSAGQGAGNPASGGQPSPGAPARAVGNAGGGFDGGFGGGDDENTPPRKSRRQHPADVERNKLIEERLDKDVSMNFAHETPLEDVLKYVKESTKDAKGKSIPIYVDPIGLQNAEKTMTSPITLDLEDVPLRTTLRLILGQLGMDYRIRDGMLYISNEDALNEDDAFILPANANADPSVPAQRPKRNPGGFQ